MTYTDDELRKATDAIDIELGQQNRAVTRSDTERCAVVALDAVLPDHDRQLLLAEAAKIQPGEHECFKPWCPDCRARKVKLQIRASLVERAAALAAPVAADTRCICEDLFTDPTCPMHRPVPVEQP